MHETKIYTNTFFQILTKVSTSGLGFIATILIARHFGASGYGDFTKITAFVGLFYLLTDFGLNAIFLQWDQDKADFRQLFYLRLILSMAIIALINALVLILPYNSQLNLGFSPALHSGIAIFSLTVLTQSIMTSAAAIFQKRLRYDLQTISTILGSLLTLSCILFFLQQKLPLNSILLSYVFGGLLTSLTALFLQGEKIKPITLSKTATVQLLTQSLPLGLMLFFNLIYFQIDTIILSFFRPAAQVGIYGYAYKYFDFLIAIPLFLSNAIYPFLLSKSQKNLRHYYLFSQKYLLIFLFFSIITLIPAWFAAPLLAIIKTDFIPAIPLFRILILSLPIFFLTSILQWILITQNQKTYLLKIYLSAAILNALLNLLFIPTYGATAAALITGISELLVLASLFYKFIRMKPSASTQT